MKRALLLLAILAAACASGPSGATAKKRVAIDLIELTGSNDSQPVGNFDVQYGVQVENLSTEPVTITRVEIRQVGTGAYVLLRNDEPRFDKKIPPGTTDGVSLWLHAYQRVAPGNFGGSEPVTVRAIVFFDSPSGHFQEIVHKTLGQF